VFLFNDEVHSQSKVTNSHHMAMRSITFPASPICVYTLPDLEATTKGIDHFLQTKRMMSRTDLSVLMQRSDFLAYLATLIVKKNVESY
jgi:uncharacterized membrane protein